MSDLSLYAVLRALDGVKAEVAGLASSLRAAEERIARLESATFTPSVSPALLDIENSTFQPAISKESAFQALLEGRPQGGTETGGYLKEKETSPGCHTPESPCDLQSQLQPIKQGIEILTEVVLRIERSSSQSRPSNPFRKYSQFPLAGPASSSIDLSLGHRPLLDQDHNRRFPTCPPVGNNPDVSPRNTSNPFLKRSQPSFEDLATSNRRVSIVNIAGPALRNPIGPQNDTCPFNQSGNNRNLRSATRNLRPNPPSARGPRRTRS